MKKRKLLSLLILPLLLGFSSCEEPIEVEYRFMLEGFYGQENTVKLDDAEALQEKIINQDDFVLLVSQSTCSGCISFKNNALNSFIKTTNSIIYEMDAGIFNEVEFENAPLKINETPTIIIFNSGLEIARKTPEKNEYFDSLDNFTEFILNYVYLPRLLSVKESQVDAMVENDRTFLLYVGWNLCGDCKKLKTRVLDQYLKNEIPDGKYILYLESNDYRINKKWQEPLSLEQWQAIEANASRSEEDYNKELEGWNNWEAFATKYHFYEFRYGKVPAIVYYENGEFNSYIVYINDQVNKSETLYTIIDSFYDNYDDKSMTEDEYLNMHDNKAKEFIKANIVSTSLK